MVDTCAFSVEAKLPDYYVVDAKYQGVAGSCMHAVVIFAVIVSLYCVFELVMAMWSSKEFTTTSELPPAYFATSDSKSVDDDFIPFRPHRILHGTTSRRPSCRRG
ncbi:hypothetical protein DIPPA_14435 [Diplonema papillatum]|nr:hypothetical protein DIPPA_14435 [Diplonema papillatum]